MKSFPVKCLQYNAMHQFGARSGPGVRIDLLEALGGASVANGGGWMTLKAWNEYKVAHDEQVKQVQLEQRAQALLGGGEGGGASAGAASGAGSASGSDGDGAGGSELMSDSARYASVVRKFFRFTGVVTDTAGGTGLNFVYECLLGCESKVSQWGAKEVSACETFVTLVLSVGSNHVSCLCCQAKADGTWKNTAGTGRLSTWLSKKYPKIYETYVLGVSPHVRSKMVDGALVKYYTFREAAACHIAYVLMCARDCRPFRLGKTAAFQLFLGSIDPSYHPPHRETCNRLLIALQLVHINRCRLLFSQLREQRGPGGWLSLQLDLWSSGLSKEAYGGLTATYVARRDRAQSRHVASRHAARSHYRYLEEVWLPSKKEFDIAEVRRHLSDDGGTGETKERVLRVVSKLLDFSAFPYIEHSGANIAKWIISVLSKYSLTLADIKMIVPDGASNGRKALRFVDHASCSTGNKFPSRP